MEVYEVTTVNRCPRCKLTEPDVYNFKNSEEFLEIEVSLAQEERKNAGLEGLVGSLECVIINTEEDRQRQAIEELLRYTGLEFASAYQDDHYRTCVLKTEDSADFLIRSRRNRINPFADLNRFPKSKHLPNTRLETFVFETRDLEKYVSIQKSRGVRFLTEDIIHTDNFSFIQSELSRFTGNSLGFIQWKVGGRDYITSKSEVLDWTFKKPNKEYLKNINELDHVATRVTARDRDAAIIEFMEHTNYNFDFAVYVNVLNSITNVTRLMKEGFAMVFTSGISPYISDELSGPTEKFIHNYGRRVHHMAFKAENIDDTFSAIKDDDMEFLVELVGSPDEGLKQTFTMPSKHTLLVNEYIHRYEGFDGFFTKSNVTELTRATEKQ